MISDCLLYVHNQVMKTSKHSSYNHSQTQSQGQSRPAKTEQQGTEQPRGEVEEIKRRIYVGGRFLLLPSPRYSILSVGVLLHARKGKQFDLVSGCF